MLSVEIVWDNGNTNDLFEYIEEFNNSFVWEAASWLLNIIKDESFNFEIDKRFVINIDGVKDWGDRSDAYDIASRLTNMIYIYASNCYDLDNVRINIEEF